MEHEMSIFHRHGSQDSASFGSDPGEQIDRLEGEEDRLMCHL